MKLKYWQELFGNQYKRLLFSLMLLFFSLIFVDEKNRISFILITLFFLNATLAVIDTFKLRKKSRFLLSILATLSVASIVVIHFLKIQNLWFVIVNQVIILIFMAISAYIILKKIFSEQKITGDTLRCGLSVYLMIGFIWASIYKILYLCDGQSFSKPFTIHDPIYFSFVTLTSTGYGDIYPVSQSARILSNIEAIAGQMYMAIIIARLVSLYSHHDRNDKDPH